MCKVFEILFSNIICHRDEKSVTSCPFDCWKSFYSMTVFCLLFQLPIYLSALTRWGRGVSLATHLEGYRCIASLGITYRGPPTPFSLCSKMDSNKSWRIPTPEKYFISYALIW